MPTRAPSPASAGEGGGEGPRRQIPSAERRKLLPKASALREEATRAERKLWQTLRDRQISGAKFRRQRPIGPYIVDFVCLEAQLIIEADGGQHADNPDDAIRTTSLEGLGFRVLRFWNNDVLKNLPGVLAAIEQALTPTLSRSRGRGSSATED